jgi:hypothetical protein
MVRMCALARSFTVEGSPVHAYLILAHKNVGQLLRLIRRLDTGQSSFFVHIDKNTDAATYGREMRELSGISNVHLVERHRSRWATFGFVRAQRATMEAALGIGVPFTHLTLLTGQDYPIRPAHEIDSFFDAHQGTSFMEYGDRNTKNFKMRKRRFQSWWLYFAGRHWEFSLRKVGIKRKVPGEMKPYRGWANFTLSRECAEYACRFVERNPRYVRFFKHTISPDEFFWHTIVLNSPLAGTVENTTLRYERFADRSGHGMVLRKEHFAEIKAQAQERFFAKKFDVTVDSYITGPNRSRHPERIYPVTATLADES